MNVQSRLLSMRVVATGPWSRAMKYLLLFLAYFALLTGVSGQYAYEAYGVAEFQRESSTDCMTEGVCVLEGFVGTVQVTHAMDSTAAQAAVYGLQEETGAMQLLGIAAVNRSHLSGRVSVKFNWQDAQVAMLVYVRRNISNHNVTLMVRERKNTTKFLLGAPDQCILCRSSATVITGMEVKNSALTIKSAASGATVTSVCSGGSPAPCPTSSNLPPHTSPALPSPSLTSIADSSASSRSVPPLVMTPSASMSEIPSSPSDTTAIPSMTTSTSVVTAASSSTTTTAGGIIPNLNVSVHNKAEVNSTSATTSLVPAIVAVLITIALIPVIVNILASS